MLLVTVERALWRYDNAFLFTNQSEVDFGIAHVIRCHTGSQFGIFGLKWQVATSTCC